MVHALGEIRRTLKSAGTLIDIRPLEAGWPVEVASASDVIEAGRLIDLPVAVADDQAASAAMREAESRGWFIKQREEEFPFYYVWDTPSEMKEFMDTEWEGFEKLEEGTYNTTKSVWSRANADAQVRVRVKMLITKWGLR